MARSINKVTIIGIVGNDVQVNALSSGSSAVNLSIATDESYNDRTTGAKVEQTEWHRVSAFGKLAEIIGQYVRKGSRIYIEGRLRTREWEKDGVKRYTTEIIANEMMLLDRASADNSRQDGYSTNTNNVAQGGYQAPQTPKQAAPMAAPAYGQPATPQQSYQQQPQPHYQAQPAAAPQQAPAFQPQPMQGGNFNDFDDDIPF